MVNAMGRIARAITTQEIRQHCVHNICWERRL